MVNRKHPGNSELAKLALASPLDVSLAVEVARRTTRRSPCRRPPGAIPRPVRFRDGAQRGGQRASCVAPEAVAASSARSAEPWLTGPSDSIAEASWMTWLSSL